MLKYSQFLNLIIADAFLSKENKTKGGDKDRAEKELTVLPINFSLLFILITVTPVANLPKTFLKYF